MKPAFVPAYPIRSGLIVVTVCALSAVPALAQNGASPSVQLSRKQLAYEIIAIAPSKSASEDSGIRNVPNGIVVSNAPLGWLVRYAYNIISDDQLSGLPGWADSDHYDIQAKMDDESISAWKSLTRDEQKYRRQILIQALLADRCGLKIHRETKQIPVYDLVIAKGGVKMKEAKAGAGSRFFAGPGHFDAQSTTIDGLLYSLSSEAGRLVINKTGISDKRFDFSLKWTSDDQQATADANPSIFAAIEEQLGLRLVSSRGPVEIVVVDRIERPSPN